MSQDSSPTAATRPRKRSRRALPLDGYAVELSLSRRSSARARIWSANLPSLGVTIVERAADASPAASAVLVVTDVPARARRARSDGLAVVAPEWCERVLATGRPCIVRAYPADFGKDTARRRRDAADRGQGCPGEPCGPVPCASVPGGGKREGVWLSGSALRPVWAVPLPGAEEWEEPSGARRREIAALVPHSLLARARCNPALVPHPNVELVRQLRRVGAKRGFTALNVAEGQVKELAYARAAAFISVLPFRVVDADDLRDVHCVSSSILDNVRGFLLHGRIVELGEFEQNEQLATVELLCSVHGISLTTARNLFAAGVRTIEDAVQHYEKGCSSPAAGALASLRTRVEPVTFEEASLLVELVAKVARSALPDFELEFKLAGGFRRGNRVGHDADVLYCHKDRRITTSVAMLLVDALNKAGILVENLRGHAGKPGFRAWRYQPPPSSHAQHEFAHDVVLTTCRLPAEGDLSTGKVVRVDFVGVRKRDEWPFATLSWSGSTLFQRELRRWCKDEHNWIINAHGLFDFDTKKAVQRSTACRTEHDIFDAIGVPYLAPYERCC